MRTEDEIWKDLEGYETPECPECFSTSHVELDQEGFWCQMCDPTGQKGIENGSEFDDTLAELADAMKRNGND